MENYKEKLLKLGLTEEEAQKFINDVVGEVLKNLPATYSIEVVYNTGDSFGSYLDHCTTSLGWKDIRVVNENIEAIREHYSAIKENDESYESIKNNWWCIKIDDSTERIYKDLYKFSINLKKDSGELVRISTPWIGYFESIEDIKIITENE